LTPGSSPQSVLPSAIQEETFINVYIEVFMLNIVKHCGVCAKLNSFVGTLASDNYY
jgi:hypothetical protein